MIRRPAAGNLNGLLPRQSSRSHASIPPSFQAHIATTAKVHDTNASALKSQRRPGGSTIWLDQFLPRSRFGRSIFSTPLLLIFRLFYQATVFDHGHIPSTDSSSHGTKWKLFPETSSKVDASLWGHSTGTLRGCSKKSTIDLSTKIETEDWPSLLQSESCPINPDSALESMTWVKSLSAPLSHEYLQFVICCNKTKRRNRFVAERDTDGDFAYLIASSDNFETSDHKIIQHRPYDYQHDLPLPLLSANWCNIPLSERPTITDLAEVLTRTSQLCPAYNVMREHCWWYAELVFEQMLVSHLDRLPLSGSGRSGGTQPDLRHWPSASYRYSYIVLDDRWLKRDTLVEQAKLFRAEMDKDGQLRW
jgi:hypothetical protein